MAVGTAPVACVVLDWKNSSTVMDMIDNFSIVTSRKGNDSQIIALLGSDH